MRKLLELTTVFCMFAAGIIFAPALCSAADASIEIPSVKPVKHALRLAHGLPPNSLYDLGCKRFAQLVNEYSHGEIEIKIFPRAMLGSEQATVKMVHLGTLDLSLQAVNNSTMWYSPMDIYVMPFIFKGRNHVENVLFGPVGQKLEKEFISASKMRIVSWFEWGDRCIFNKVRAINTPDDLKGICIRVPKNSVMVDTYNTLGSTAKAIDWGELYSALQQGLADGLEGPPQGMIDMKFYDFLKYYSYINVFYGLADIVMNEKLFQSMSPENQAVILRAGKEAGKYQRWVSAKSHIDGVDGLSKLGVSINRVEDRQAFVDKVKPVWDKYKGKLGEELFEAIINTK